MVSSRSEDRKAASIVTRRDDQTEAREALASMLRDAKARTLELVSGLTADQLMGPRLAIVNPLRWEVGHVAWFQEFWALRHLWGEPPIRADADSLYDSARVAHDTRWDLPLPSMEETLAYGGEVLERVLDRVANRDLTEKADYFYRLALFHEDMHGEAFTYTRQTLAYPAPAVARGGEDRGDGSGTIAGDASIPGGEFLLGATRDSGFVFDNEKWAHAVAIAPFRIARAAVTNAEFATFVEAGGYLRRDLWSEEGWTWRTQAGAQRPVYWERSPGGGFTWRRYDRVVALPEHQPVIHVNAHEAEAWCRWAGRRLPTEAEWELAASGFSVDGWKSRFPWGGRQPTPELANLDSRAGGCIDVGALGAGDSPFGCRQMLGNVWEWTATRFAPYPGFVPDPYKEYSEPWFHSPHRVLRGGCWATRARLLRNTWRNFYEPHRRDVFGGFRTCAQG
jgi:iron(II)-dependent oxidoreductase